MSSVHNIFLIGPMGAGKSTIGRALARELSFDFYDTDEVIESRAGAQIDWIFDIEGEQGFRQREKKVIAELVQLSNIVLATGGGAVLKAKNRNFLAGRGVVVYLQASLQQQLARTKRDNNKRPLLKKAKDVEQYLGDLAAIRTPLYEEIADFIFDTEGQSIKVMVEQIIKALQEGGE